MADESVVKFENDVMNEELEGVNKEVEGSEHGGE